MCAALALTLVAAVHAAAQGDAPQERIKSALARAADVGVVSLLESKIAEGRAKGVSQERIAAAIERRLAALERARQVLRGDADSPATLAVAADAMEAGVSESVLKAIASSAPQDRRNVAIVALTELVNRGQASDVALQRVQDALQRGPDALANLPAEAVNRGASGRTPDPGPQDNRGRGGSGGASVGGSSPGGGAGRGAGRGTPGGPSAGPETGPPSAVPAPGQGSQAGKPDNPGRGNAGAGTQGSGGGSGNAGAPGQNPGRGRGQ